MGRVYDAAVIGGGPGGYTAALYCARAGLDTVVLEKLSAGGQMAEAVQVDNYPGFDQGVEGFALAENMRRGAERFGAESRLSTVLRAELTGPVKRLETSEGLVEARCVLIASGARPRKLDLPRETEFTGRGVSYCAACDGMACRGETAVVAGGGSAAVEDALLLSRLCRQVILVHRRDRLRAEAVCQRALFQAENVSVQWDSTVTALLGEERLTGVRLRNLQTGRETALPCRGLFVSIGRIPETELFQGAAAMDRQGWLLADETTQTNLPGVFAVGDVRAKAVRQIVTAAADGAAAAHFAQVYLTGQARA